LEVIVKVGLTIAPETALPSAYAVFRDRLEISMEKAARFGYDGVELALLNAKQAETRRMRRALTRYNLEIPVITTGQVFAEGRVWFTHPDMSVRRKAVDTMKELIELGAEFGAKVNVGRVRGFIEAGQSRDTAERRFLECMHECADFAMGSGVEMLIEPVNRFDLNYINSVPEGLEALRKLDCPNVKLMPDVFHMNIEDASITGSLEEAGDAVGYVHVADSNRRAPGMGHLDFSEIVSTLRKIGYDWYLTAEIDPYPDADTAAESAVRYLRTILDDSQGVN
jgi:sugar phosphate isomerase/epimerase